MPRGVKRSRDDLLQGIVLDGVIYSLILENNETEKKFYEISVEKNSQWFRVITRYGRYGSKGISVFKEFDEEEEMKKYIDKIYREKIRKGYEEEQQKTTASSSTSTSSSAVQTVSTSTSAVVSMTSHDSDSDSILSEADLKAALLKKNIAETKGFWLCFTCTFQNKPSSPFCEVCQKKRVIPPPSTYMTFV